MAEYTGVRQLGKLRSVGNRPAGGLARNGDGRQLSRMPHGSGSVFASTSSPREVAFHPLPRFCYLDSSGSGERILA